VIHNTFIWVTKYRPVSRILHPAGSGEVILWVRLRSVRLSLVTLLQQKLQPPEASNSLKNSSVFTSSWLEANTRFQSIIGSVLAVTHPGQYNAGLDMIKALKDNPSFLREQEEIAKVLDCWCTAFSGVSVICNGKTPRHRDVQGRHEWYDVLANMGTHPTIRFGLPGLRTTLAYDPRTVVSLCSHILSYTVDSIDCGDRAAFAWFMREDVRAYLDVVPGAPSTLEGVVGSISS
jgi:hypothetical protein